MGSQKKEAYVLSQSRKSEAASENTREKRSVIGESGICMVILLKIPSLSVSAKLFILKMKLALSFSFLKRGNSSWVFAWLRHFWIPRTSVYKKLEEKKLNKNQNHKYSPQNAAPEGSRVWLSPGCYRTTDDDQIGVRVLLIENFFSFECGVRLPTIKTHKRTQCHFSSPIDDWKIGSVDGVFTPHPLHTGWLWYTIRNLASS